MKLRPVYEVVVECLQRSTAGINVAEGQIESHSGFGPSDFDSVRNYEVGKFTVLLEVL